MSPPLKDVLGALGMPTAFTDAADFAAMTDDASDLKIGAVLHQTFIAVDEYGTEAAAATAVTMQAVSMPSTPTWSSTGRSCSPSTTSSSSTPLFLGRVADPSAS